MDTRPREAPKHASESAKAGELTAGLGRSLSLRIRAEVDGRQVLDREGDSLLLGFVSFLHKQMRGFGVNYPRKYEGDLSRRDPLITSVDDAASSPLRLGWETRGSYYFGRNAFWSIGDTRKDVIYIGGNAQLAENSPYAIVDHSPFDNPSGWIELNEARWNPATEAYEDTGTPFAVSAPEDFVLDAPLRVKSTRRAGGLEAHRHAFNNAKIVVGASASPPSLEDLLIIEFEKEGLSIGPMNRPPPTIESYTASLKFNRSVTNNTGADLDIKEVGLEGRALAADYSYSDDPGEGYTNLLARDVVDVTVPAGSQATFYYAIEVNNSAGGGVMAQFLQLLHRHTATTFREAVDISNQNQNEENNYWTFRLTNGVPGMSNDYRGRYRDRPLNVGLMVGTGTNEVSNTDFALDSRIVHGGGDGELHHYGVYVSDCIIEEGNGRAFFTVERVFENKTASDITISETGLYGGASDRQGRGNQGSRYLRDQHLITRNVLEEPITISAGKIKKLYYEVGIRV